jgi:hypothetical protein
MIRPSARRRRESSGQRAVLDEHRDVGAEGMRIPYGREEA